MVNGTTSDNRVGALSRYAAVPRRDSPPRTLFKFLNEAAGHEPNEQIDATFGALWNGVDHRAILPARQIAGLRPLLSRQSTGDTFWPLQADER
jgi:hypothetical protein